jgi:hypothetical protein
VLGPLFHVEELEDVPLDNVSNRVSVPDIVITGVGDSGTRGVLELLEHLGVTMCPEKHKQGDNYWTKPPQLYIPDLLISAGGRVNDMKGQLSSPAFGHAVQRELDGASKTLECSIIANNLTQGALPANFKWGYKNPRHFYMLPVMDVAFGREHKVLAVARDPRDICTGSNRHQLWRFGGYVSTPVDLEDFRAAMTKAMPVEERAASPRPPPPPGVNISGGTSTLLKDCIWVGDSRGSCVDLAELKSCMEFWASVWSSTIKEYADSATFRIVRIEDLVVPNPVTSIRSTETLELIMKYVGISSDSATMQAELEHAHSYKDRYMGQREEWSAQDRATLEAETASMMPGLVHEVMLALGYNLSHYGLVTPAYTHVISPSGSLW